MNSTDLLTLREVSVERGRFRLHEIGFGVAPGWSAVIGRSGAGKTTLARIMAGLSKPDRGSVQYFGPSPKRGNPIQLIYQSARETFDPRLPLKHSPGMPDPTEIHLQSLFGHLDLSPKLWTRKPGALSGGQLQRLALVRALAVGPSILILDEPTSALDHVLAEALLSVVHDWIRSAPVGSPRAAVLISHDLSLVEGRADTVVVLDQGRLVENASFGELHHPVSQALLEAASRIRGKLQPERPDL